MNKKLTLEQEIAVCNLYVKNISVHEIMNLYNIKYYFVYRILKRHNIKVHIRKYTKKEEDYIVNKYLSGINSNLIAKEFNTAGSVIQNILKRNGIKLRAKTYSARKYSVDENYFDEIDNQDKAYFLGFLYADGCNHSPSNTIQLKLQEEDKEILLKLNKIIKNTRPLSFSNNSKRGWKNSFGIVVSNKHMSEILSKHGVVQNKTFKLTFPEWLREDLIPHFIRGYFDGDGCISFPKNEIRRVHIDIISTESFCKSLAKYLKEKININLSVYNNCYNNGNTITKQILFGGRHQVLRFLELIYKDANLYLKRKKDKSDILLNYIPIQITKEKKFCSIDGCNNEHHAKNLCSKHYQYLKKHDKIIT